MANEQDYRVSYVIDVEATPATKQVQSFADSIGNLYKANGDFKKVAGNIKGLMDDLEKTFRPKGRKRDYTFHFDIKTNDSEAKLQRIAGLLTSISVMAKDIRVNINPGVPLQTHTIKAQTKQLADRSALEALKKENAATAAGTIKGVFAAQKKITHSIGKVNAAMAHFGKGRELNIKTDVAKKRLEEILALLQEINYQSRIAHLGNPVPASPQGNNYMIPYALGSRPFLSGYGGGRIDSVATNKEFLKQKAGFLNSQRIAGRYERLHTNQELLKQKTSFVESQRLANFEIWKKKEELKEKAQLRQEELKSVKRHNKELQQHEDGRRRSAINRLQYSNPFSLRNMPFAYMFNAYMGYSLMKSELTKAVDYGNIMESAQSILKVSDTDLSSFEHRFDRMAKNVRKIGIETKFSAIEVAGAVKFLSMAGMDISTINASIRPITNLALIGDNDIATIADLSTNIMAGYDINSNSMPIVADILSSTISRSNVNILEMAESYKMAAGYMRMAGIDFAESAAAIGILGNMGLKGSLSGTSLRALTTRFAKPTKQSAEAMMKLNISFTTFEESYGGKKVEKLRPLYEIFAELKKKGASLSDLQSIFGKYGGSAALMFMENSDKLKELTAQNKTSFGMSDELAKVKQNTTKGLWAQVTSQFSESFMQGFEVLEPQIKRVLHGFLAKFSAPEFAKGLASVGRALLDIFSVLGNITTWFTRNFSVLEPLIFTYMVSTRLYKLAGGLTNIGVALGFIGKQAAASSVLQTVAGAAAGSTAAPAKGLVSRIVSGVTNRTATTALLSSQVATGGGLMGATGSLAAMGAGAIAATAGITALIGVLGWAAYKIWKVKEAKDAVTEELDNNRKYRYKSIEDLHDQLHRTYTTALLAKGAVDDLTEGKTISEASGINFGFWGMNKLASLATKMNQGFQFANGYTVNEEERYSAEDAHRDNSVGAAVRLSDKHGQKILESAIAEFTQFTEPSEVKGFINAIPQKYGLTLEDVDEKLYKERKKKAPGYVFKWKVMGEDEEETVTSALHHNSGVFIDNFGELPEEKVAESHPYVLYRNSEIVPSIETLAESYLNAISSFEGAKNLLENDTDFGAGTFKFSDFEKYGFFMGKNGFFTQTPLRANATEDEKAKHFQNYLELHNMLSTLAGSLRKTFGSPLSVETIFKKAGIKPYLYENDPKSNKPGYDANRITNDPDDGLAGGNYSGTSKLSSAAPKQVIVKITNLLSMEAINLMKTENGSQLEIQDLKEQLAQALIDVVHDFDASWNA